jgi:hypothetical protein
VSPVFVFPWEEYLYLYVLFAVLLSSLIVKIGQLPSIQLFHLHLAIFSFLEENVGASWTSYLVLLVALTEIWYPALINSSIDGDYSNATDGTLHGKAPVWIMILLIKELKAKKKERPESPLAWFLASLVPLFVFEVERQVGLCRGFRSGACRRDYDR